MKKEAEVVGFYAVSKNEMAFSEEARFSVARLASPPDGNASAAAKSGRRSRRKWRVFMVRIYSGIEEVYAGMEEWCVVERVYCGGGKQGVV